MNATRLIDLYTNTVRLFLRWLVAWAASGVVGGHKRRLRETLLDRYLQYASKAEFVKGCKAVQVDGKVKWIPKDEAVKR